MATHNYKFIRLVVSATVNANVNAILSEVRFYSDNYTTLIDTTNAIATASSETNSTSYAASKAIDGVTSTAWQCNAPDRNGAQWLQIEFPSPVSVATYELYYHYWTYNSFKDWTIEGSNDGVSWVVINTETGATRPASYTYTKFVGAISIGRTLPIVSDLTAGNVLLKDTAVSYDNIGVSELFGKSLSPAYDLLLATNIDRFLNHTYDLIRTTPLRSRIINDWGLLSGSTVLSGSIGLSYDINPPTGNLSVTLPAIGANAVGGNIGLIKLPKPSLSASATSGGNSTVSVSIPSITLSAYFGAIATASVPSIGVTANATSGGLGSLAASLPSLGVSVTVGNQTFANLSAQISKVGVVSTSVSGGLNTISAPIKVGLSGNSLTGFTSNVRQVLPSLKVSGSGYADGVATVSAALPMIRIGTIGRNADGTGVFSGWALNLENGATTEYRGWEFNSITNFAGKELAASLNGIVDLQGNLDGQYTIDAEAITSVDELGSNKMKRARDCLVGLRSDGELSIFTITDENTVRNYPLTRVRDGLHEQRVKLARGVKSRYWQFGIKNVNGAKFELDNINIKVDELSRRVR